jgi:predicted dehydrogenase
MIDMFCHWRYVIDNLFGPIKRVSAIGATHVPTRIDEAGNAYECTAEDAAYGTFELESGVICHINSSWSVRVRRDDLLTIQVDGTAGSAVAGLRQCYIQADAMTPKPVWNPDVEGQIDYFGDWKTMPDRDDTTNAFRTQWELFLLHVADGRPFPWTLLEGARGVQLAELGLKSWKERRWVDVPSLS